jgi:hypothetical protein
LDICKYEAAVRGLAYESLPEVPDSIDFADLTSQKRDVAQLVARMVREARLPEACAIFPYPNGAKFRTLVIGHPIDVLRLRISLIGAVETFDSSLEHGVCASRLATGGCAWRLHEKKEAWSRSLDLATTHLSARNQMSAFDIRNYYGSIDRCRLFETLERAGLCEEQRKELARILDCWAARDGVSGIPIGPSTSAVMGTLFLRPIDVAIASRGLPFTRFTDDIRVFSNADDGDVGLHDLVASQARLLGLSLNDDKTRVFDRAAAHLELRSPTLSSWGYKLKMPSCDAVALRRAFDHAVSGDTIHPSEFRWFLRALKNRRDDHAVEALLSSNELLLIDPRLCGDYLSELSSTENKARIADLLDSGVSDAAVELHLLRAVKGGAASDISRITIDRARTASEPLVRAQAIVSMAVNDVRAREQSIAIAADTAASYWERRAAVLHLRRVQGRARDNALRHVASSEDAVLALSARWAQAA